MEKAQGGPDSTQTVGNPVLPGDTEQPKAPGWSGDGCSWCAGSPSVGGGGIAHCRSTLWVFIVTVFSKSCGDLLSGHAAASGGIAVAKGRNEGV